MLGERVGEEPSPSRSPRALRAASALVVRGLPWRALVLAPGSLRRVRAPWRIELRLGPPSVCPILGVAGVMLTTARLGDIFTVVCGGLATCGYEP